MKTELIKISKIVHNTGQIDGLPKNPRKKNDELFAKLVKSIQDDPEMLELRELLVYPHGDKYIVIAGNMRLDALKQLGYKDAHCKVIPIETPVEKLKAYTIKDNASFGEWDMDMLVADWDVEQLDEWGVDIDVENVEVLDEEEVHEDEFDESEVTESIVQPLDVWKLGEHRLMCGDSTSANDVAVLMGGAMADMVFTDPPYGVNIVNNNSVGGEGKTHFGSVGGDKIVKTNKYIPIKGDDTTDTAKLNYDIVKDISKNQIIFGGNYFTDFLSPSPCWVVWDKQNTGNFADVEMAWTSFKRGAKLYSWLWNGLCRKGSRDIEGVKRVHPTQKPVGLICDILKDFTNENDIILDCFGGSGSTLISCEQLHRKCYMMEFEQHYCDVIIARWEKLTGQKAVKL